MNQALLAGQALLAALLIAPMTGERAATAAVAAPNVARHKIYGFAQSFNGTTLVIKSRRGQTIAVDVRGAHGNVTIYRNRPVIVFGTTDTSGIVHATAVWRTYPDAVHWPADR